VREINAGRQEERQNKEGDEEVKRKEHGRKKERQE
jgi:hypothetical protein